MKARHILLALGATLLYTATLNAQGRDNRWDTGVSGNGALGQAITLAGGGDFSVPPASGPTSVGSSDSSSDSSSSGDGSYSSGSYSGDYSGVGSAIAGGLIGGRGTSRFLGPGDDDARWDFSDERVDGIHGLWYGIRGIGRGIGSVGAWIGDGIGNLFSSNNFRAKSGCIMDTNGTVYEVWGRRNKGYGIHSSRKKWEVRPFYENIRLVALHGAVAKFKGFWGMIDPLSGKTLKDFEFVYDKYSGYYYPDGPAYFVCAFGQTSRSKNMPRSRCSSTRPAMSAPSAGTTMASIPCAAVGAKRSFPPSSATFGIPASPMGTTPTMCLTTSASTKTASASSTARASVSWPRCSTGWTR